MTQLNRLCASLLLLFSFSSYALAQQTPADQQRRRCAADEVHQQHYANDPAYREAFDKLQQRIQERIAAGEVSLNASGNKTSMQNGGSKFVIPTVVHVVWGHGPNNGDDSIPKAQVKSQFDALFRDYRNVPNTIGFSNGGIDTKIEFDLATVDPNGNPTDGIVYHNDPPLSDHTRSADPAIDEETTLKTKYSWDKSKYLNVWVVGVINLQGVQGIPLGYARFPPAGNEDGVVVVFDAFGTTGNLDLDNSDGRTMTHEFGHSLNLFHPFQGGCGTSNCQATGDRVCDTPPAETETFGQPNNRRNSCVGDIPDRPDDLRLYMDYTDDSYVNHFTPGQFQRMLTVLQDPQLNQRFNLWQDANLQATGTGKYKAPEAGFHAKLREAHVGDSLRFREFSRRQPTSYQWNFFGGTADDPTAANPVVSYSSPGTYDVQLIVDNNSNQPDTLLKQDYITIRDTSYGLPFAEGFEAPSLDAPPFWTVLNPDGANSAFSNLKWERTAVTGAFGNSSRTMRLRFGGYNHFKARDAMITPTLDFANTDSATLSFDVSYEPLRALQSDFPEVKNNLLFSDTLEVLATSNGGLTWTSVYKAGGNDLAHDGDRATSVINSPDDAAWRTDSISLDQFAGESQVRIMFRGINSYGNNLFLDNVAVDTTGIQAITGQEDALTANVVKDVRLMPNPTRGQFDLQFGLKQRQALQLRVYDLQGRIISEQRAEKPAGNHSLGVDLREEPAGVYLVRFLAGDQQVLRRVVKQ